MPLEHVRSLENMDQFYGGGYGIDVIYLDYQKAFDTVPIKRLMQKLKGY